MIPGNLNSDTAISSATVNTTEQTLTYKVVSDKGRVVGMVDDLEALKQTIAIILSVERYEHLIYSWDYGIELDDLFGMDVAYVCPELTRRITEALTQDERILSVDNYSFDKFGNAIFVSFTVHSIYGDIDASKEVEI